MIGLDGTTYYADGGVPALSSAYTEITDIVEGVEASGTRDEAQVKLRGDENTLYEVGHIDRSVTMAILYDPDNTEYQALETIFENRGIVGMAFLDGPIAAGMTGFEGDYKISEWSKPQPIDGVWMVNTKFVPAVGGQITTRPYSTPDV